MTSDEFTKKFINMVYLKKIISGALDVIDENGKLMTTEEIKKALRPEDRILLETVEGQKGKLQ